MRSLRGTILTGAFLWTIGLMAGSVAVVNVAVTLHHSLWTRVILVHAHGRVMAAVAAASMLVGLVLFRRGLAPLDALRRRLADVQRGSERRLIGAYPAEVQPLVTDLNALLEHRDQAIARALAKAGDLAHGLKTPLAILAQDAERADAAGQPDLGAAISEQVERMRRQIDYHLAHARAAASGATAGVRCLITDSAEPLARTMRRLHEGRGIAVDVQGAPEPAVRCQREDLDEMLGNLLDNGCKWARARVVLSVAKDEDLPAGFVQILVDDDGPGIEPGLRAAVLQRGVRADEAAPGSGFGLAIVRDLAELYGGTIALDRAPLGGLRARLTLPRA